MIVSQLGRHKLMCRWSMGNCLVVVAALIGCSHNLKTTLNGYEPMNRSSSDGSSNPVVVRVYQLQTDIKFRQATLEAILQDDRKAFGESLLKKEEFTVHPKETLPLKLKLAKGVQFIGVVADFYRPDKDRWRFIYPVKNPKDIGIIESIIVDNVQIKK